MLLVVPNWYDENSHNTALLTVVAMDGVDGYFGYFDY
jgi:hypothetical protein